MNDLCSLGKCTIATFDEEALIARLRKPRNLKIVQSECFRQVLINNLACKHDPDAILLHCGHIYNCFQCCNQAEVEKCLYCDKLVYDVIRVKLPSTFKISSVAKALHTEKCVCCRMEPIRMVFYPCGHLCLCLSCSEKMNRILETAEGFGCLICQQPATCLVEAKLIGNSERALDIVQTVEAESKMQANATSSFPHSDKNRFVPMISSATNNFIFVSNPSLSCTGGGIKDCPSSNCFKRNLKQRMQENFGKRLLHLKQRLRQRRNCDCIQEIPIIHNCPEIVHSIDHRNLVATAQQKKTSPTDSIILTVPVVVPKHSVCNVIRNAESSSLHSSINKLFVEGNRKIKISINIFGCGHCGLVDKSKMNVKRKDLAEKLIDDKISIRRNLQCNKHAISYCDCNKFISANDCNSFGKNRKLTSVIKCEQTILPKCTKQTKKDHEQEIFSSNSCTTNCKSSNRKSYDIASISNQEKRMECEEIDAYKTFTSGISNNSGQAATSDCKSNSMRSINLTLAEEKVTKNNESSKAIGGKHPANYSLTDVDRCLKKSEYLENICSRYLVLLNSKKIGKNFLDFHHDFNAKGREVKINTESAANSTTCLETIKNISQNCSLKSVKTSSEKLTVNPLNDLRHAKDDSWVYFITESLHPSTVKCSEHLPNDRREHSCFEACAGQSFILKGGSHSINSKSTCSSGNTIKANRRNSWMPSLSFHSMHSDSYKDDLLHSCKPLQSCGIFDAKCFSEEEKPFSSDVNLDALQLCGERRGEKYKLQEMISKEMESLGRESKFK